MKESTRLPALCRHENRYAFAVEARNRNSGFEPAVWRKFVRVERAGDNWFEWDSHGGPGYWNLAWTGLGNGAAVRIYRIVARGGQPLSYANGTDMNDAAGADHVVLLGVDRVPAPSPKFPQGGYIANDERDGNQANDGHRVYLAKGGHDLRYGDYVYMTLKTTGIGPEASPPDLRQHYRGAQPFFSCAEPWRGRLVPHAGQLPPEFKDPGETCLLAQFDNDAKHEHRPFTPHEVSFDELMASVPERGRKPALRCYNTIYHASTVEALMGDFGNSTWEVSWNMGFGNAPVATLAQSMLWAYKTGDRPETRVVPHLTFNEEYVESDWRAIVEYLGVPYDPKTDTPESKPHAYRRYVYRGENGAPWTEEFREIIVESVPTYRRNEQEIPLLAAYALTGDRVCSLFLLNRKMPGRHSGTDFGAGTTPVTVRLPFDSVTRLMVYRIARTDGTPADPRDNNLESSKVSIISQELPTSVFRPNFTVNDKTGALPEGLPPGGIYLYVFER